MNSTDQNAYILAQQWKQPLDDASEVVIDALLNHHSGIADMQELVDALHHAASTFDQLRASVEGVGTLFGNSEDEIQPLEQGCVQLGSTLVNWDDSITIYTHCKALFEAVRNLVTHSKNAKKGAAIRIEVTALAEDSVQIAITDNCGGIPGAIKERFENSALEMYEKFGGLEMGLLVSQRLVSEVLKGTMDIESPYTHSDGIIGTRYTITIPDLRS